MEDVNVVKIVRVTDLDACVSYEVSQHEEADDWVVLSSREEGELATMRKETALAIAKAILEVFE
jgi:hypothetical protein